MKTAGWIILVFGSLAFLGAALNGNNVFGPIFWIALGLFLIHRGKTKEKEKKGAESRQDQVISQNDANSSADH